jgi:hypothetical protein
MEDKKGNLDQSILSYSNADIINLRRYEAGRESAEDKNNETKYRSGGNLSYWDQFEQCRNQNTGTFCRHNENSLRIKEIQMCV